MAAAKTNEKSAPGAESENLPATISGGGLPGFLADQLEADAGMGLSKAADDNILPLMYVLQSNSPQVQRGNPAMIKGAKPGDLWIKGTSEAIDGETGLVVQPCAFRKDWVEWVPRNAGGGYVGRHDSLPADAREKEDENGRKKNVLPNNNEVNETRYHYVLADSAPIVIPFSSTGHTTSRDWMNKMNNLRLPNKKSAPAFAGLWRLTTAQRTNKAGSWYVIVATYEGWVGSVEEYELGKTLFEQVESGAVKAGDEDAAQNSSGVTDGVAHDPETGEVLNDKGDIPF